MRYFLIVFAPLVASCAASANTQAPMPRAIVQYRDLALDTQRGQSTLVARVQQSASDFCQAHGFKVTPQHLRHNRRFCPTVIRGLLLQQMTPVLRRAYDAGRRR